MIAWKPAPSAYAGKLLKVGGYFELDAGDHILIFTDVLGIGCKRAQVQHRDAVTFAQLGNAAALCCKRTKLRKSYREQSPPVGHMIYCRCHLNASRHQYTLASDTQKGSPRENLTGVYVCSRWVAFRRAKSAAVHLMKLRLKKTQQRTAIGTNCSSD